MFPSHDLKEREAKLALLKRIHFCLADPRVRLPTKAEFDSYISGETKSLGKTQEEVKTEAMMEADLLGETRAGKEQAGANSL